MKSEQLFKKAIRLIPQGVNSPVRYYEPYPFFVKSANGSKIIDVDDNVYIDYCMGYGSLLLGHLYKDVLESVLDQLKRGTLFCTPTSEEVELAELMSNIIPSAEMVRLMNTGAEATMHAIRLARAYTKRSKIIKFEGCYHGAYDYVLVKAGSGALSGGIARSEGMLECVASNTLVIPYNDIESLEKIFKTNDDIACVIVEPVAANMGLILPKPGYLQRLRKITQENGSILIFDEVVTGFRLALGGAQEYYNIKPDLSTFGKALSNGFVISALVGKKEIMSNLSPLGSVYQASTFAGNPLSVSAAIATLKFLQRNKNLYVELEKKQRTITNAVRDLIKDLKINASINSIASMFQVFFTDREVVDYDSAKSSDVLLFKRYFNTLLKNGVFIPPSQFETCFLSYSHTEEDIEKSIEAFSRSLKELRS